MNKDILSLSKLYNIKDENVYKFIDKNIFLLDLLKRLSYNIKKIFDDREIRLEYKCDPEINNHCYIFVGINTNDLSVDESLNKLYEFDHKYFFDELKDEKIHNKIMIDVRHYRK